jgi:hypothetical protein
MTINLCPKCLNVLPDDYPFDHVAIDRALAGDTSVLRGMDLAERRELVQTARRSGMTEYAIAARLNRSAGEIRRWFDGPRPRSPRTTAFDHAVRALYEAERLSDPAIARRLGVSKNAVLVSRRRQHLPALYASYGLILPAVTA